MPYQLTVKAINCQTGCLRHFIANNAVTSWPARLLVTTDPHPRLASYIQLQPARRATRQALPHFMQQTGKCHAAARQDTLGCPDGFQMFEFSTLCCGPTFIWVTGCSVSGPCVWYMLPAMLHLVDDRALSAQKAEKQYDSVLMMWVHMETSISIQIPRSRTHLTSCTESL